MNCLAILHCLIIITAREVFSAFRSAKNTHNIFTPKIGHYVDLGILIETTWLQIWTLISCDQPMRSVMMSLIYDV